MNIGYSEFLKEREELKEKLKDLEEYGDKLMEEIYYVFGSKVKIEIYELNCKIYYVRYADDQCLEIRNLRRKNEENCN